MCVLAPGLFTVPNETDSYHCCSFNMMFGMSAYLNLLQLFVFGAYVIFIQFFTCHEVRRTMKENNKAQRAMIKLNLKKTPKTTLTEL